MERTARQGLAAAVAGIAIAAGACGGADGGGQRSLRVSDGTHTGPLQTKTESCRFDGTRQIVARGTIRNAGDVAHNFRVSVRFNNAGGVRIEKGDDFLSDVSPGETVRWETTVYGEELGDVVDCKVESTQQ